MALNNVLKHLRENRRWLKKDTKSNPLQSVTALIMHSKKKELHGFETTFKYVSWRGICSKRGQALFLIFMNYFYRHFLRAGFHA